MQTEKSSLTSGVGTLSLYFSKTQLLPLALSLECLGENKACILLYLTKTRCLAQGPIYLLPHSEGNDDRQSCLWLKSMMEKWIAISYFRARNKNSSETGLCSGIHLRKKLCAHFGEDPKTSQMWRKKQGNGPKVNEDPEGSPLYCALPYSGHRHSFLGVYLCLTSDLRGYSLLRGDAHTLSLWLCISA